MYDVRQRRVNERTALASTLKDAALHTLSLLRENIRYWEAQAAALPAEEVGPAPAPACPHRTAQRTRTLTLDSRPHQ